MLFRVLLLISCALAAKIRPFPETDLDLAKLPAYAVNDPVKLACNARQIDNGEHKFDANGNVVLEPVVRCLETNAPLAFKYGVNERITCTVKFEDELYHLFQLYLHNDVPFSCRMDVKPATGVTVPLVFQFRGVVEESHFDIDPNLNVLLLSKDNQIVSSTAWSSSLNTTKVIIGDQVPLQFDVHWIDGGRLDVNDQDVRFLRLPNPPSFALVALYCLASIVLGAVGAVGLGYKRISKKIQLSDLSKVD
ncbi:hypothetical protein OGAPHI_002953 [Ogataea philodendri]|uniref:Uncharacterized protein n=1 Tax=Ogataea philodendri TaxID=1378263 RepID=A0A9P8P9S0_9ASCO|nr:uncharacterized protein OGAPHI_002953 [Ogataea philodendri]KAH3667304.1 hypothetical protein OGAPHI_002953 [Ogataea philodendri]